MANAPVVVPPLTPVVSSNIEAVGHSGDSLFVKFKPKEGEATGPTWFYRGVPASHASEITKSASPGGMFHRLIKAAHVPGEKVEG